MLFKKKKEEKSMRTCPVCGQYTFTEPHDICPICGWEDDPVQLKDPDFTGGANKPSLNQAKEEWNNSLINGENDNE